MADQYVAEIRIVGFNYPPSGWSTCKGQLLQIRQQTGLFQVIGNSFGGDGRNTFALPYLEGSFPVGAGQGPGLAARAVGDTGGAPDVTLKEAQMPPHIHFVDALDAVGQSPSAEGHVLARYPGAYQTDLWRAQTHMNERTLQIAGGNGAHNNMPPYLALQYVIALTGVSPPRPPD